MPFVSDEEWEAILAKQTVLEKRVAELEARLSRYENAHTPSSMSGIHISHVGGNRPGRQKGHEGSGRKTPTIIDKHKFLKLKSCPHCGGKLRKIGKRKRTTTGIKPGKAINTEYEIERSYCKHCDKIVEPIITTALPNSRFGLSLALYITFLSVLGITLSKIRTILLHDYNLAISKGTIANTIEQLAEFLGDDYEKLRQQLLNERDVFADETSDPIHGKNGWLWTFISKTIAYLKVDMSRGQKVVEKTLHGYSGILHSDFWNAYNTLKCDKQKCLAHLTRELHHLREKKRSKELKTYCSKLLRLLRYAKDNNRHSAQFREFCEKRLHATIDAEYTDKDCQRLNKRLRRHAREIFTFTEIETETTNNNAERSLRPNVIKRKNTYGSYSLDGAQAHAIMASFYQTSQLQHQNYESFVRELVENQLQNKTGN